MNEPDPAGISPGATSTDDAPTAEQTALLRYLEVMPAGPFTRAQAGALIDLLEAAPDWQPHLQAWHRDKTRLHPELFAAPPRPYREARWWQSQITEGSMYGYSFRQPSVNQTLVILESLDRQTPGWDRESKKRRAHRFMNELAALSPELCKPGCSFPHELPADGDDAEETFTPAAPPPAVAPTFAATPPIRTLSAPFVPNAYAASPPAAPSQPAWQPPVQPPTQNAAVRKSVPEGKGGARGWALLLLCLAAGAGAYGYFGFQASAPVRNDAPASSIVNLDNPGGPAKQSVVILPTMIALDSQKRAMEKYPELARGGSPLNQKFVALVHKLEVERSPRLQQPDWPEQLANECATALAIAPVIPKATTAPPPAPSAPGTTPAPSAHKTVFSSLVPAAPVVAAATPAPTPVPTPVPVAAPVATPRIPAGNIFVTLDAVNKASVNNYRYNWISAYGNYDLSFRQSVGIDVKVRNMMRNSIPVTLRWAFFARRNQQGDRYIFAAAEKRLDLAPGQTISEALDSPLVQGTSVGYYDYGWRYYVGSRYEGWLVQILPDGDDGVIKQVGSTSYIEDFAKRSDFPDLIKQRIRSPNGAR